MRVRVRERGGKRGGDRGRARGRQGEKGRRGGIGMEERNGREVQRRGMGERERERDMGGGTG